MARFNLSYRSLGPRWRDRDPIVEAVQTMLEDEHLNPTDAHALSGVAAGTVTNWISGKTKKPQNITVAALSTSVGYVRRDNLDKEGNLVPALVKVRDKDYVKEREMQATWLIKQGRGPKKKPRKKKKTNGHA